MAEQYDDRALRLQGYLDESIQPILDRLSVIEKDLKDIKDTQAQLWELMKENR
ncbi:hypothetical protein [Bacillus piscicola]|uniref:hypothetical protein n=1 Tax=Bacillus piscicola TaxID=1632684 RepID=UPI001F093FB5|nr:hypothetical protein [Bacillus piscicola]